MSWYDAEQWDRLWNCLRGVQVLPKDPQTSRKHNTCLTWWPRDTWGELKKCCWARPTKLWFSGLGPALGLQRAQNGLLSSQKRRHLTCKASMSLRSSPSLDMGHTQRVNRIQGGWLELPHPGEWAHRGRGLFCRLYEREAEPGMVGI